MCLSADELQAFKDGNNNWDIVRAVAAASPHTRRWGLTASVYNNSWEDVRVPAAWVTGNDKYLSSSEDVLRKEVVRAAYEDNGERVFYHQTAVPISELPELETKLLFIPYLDPAEAVMDQWVVQGPSGGVKLGNGLANMYPKELLKAEAHDPCVPQVKKRRADDSKVTSDTKAWAEQREVAALRLVGKFCTAACRLLS